MKKVLVICSSGAGKSTFARKLRDLTGLPLYHLDMLWHKPDRTTVSKDEFDRQLEKLLGQDEWILDGNFQRTLETRLRACDTVFLLDLPLEICLASVENRIGQKRDDMPWIETEFDPEFKQWIMEFPEKKLPRIYELLDKYQGRKNIVIFKSRKETDSFFNLRLYSQHT